ncbi:hypothetical protein BOVA713_141 [Bacteroides ovatus]|nr:hypothetical protein BOVA713_141 [Bacteroides ovatus]
MCLFRCTCCTPFSLSIPFPGLSPVILLPISVSFTPSESLSFCTAKVYGCGGNERVPAYSL